MSIDAAAIENIALLARLRIDESDIDEVTARIGDILALVGQMESVDTEGVEPMANPMDAIQRLREDVVTEVDVSAEFQLIAPATEEGLYLVPRVIE
jgi:aspartyl-tRNA(Asn)/glutamyl-tRNA(Gln) amidotransferase subunit C